MEEMKAGEGDLLRDSTCHKREMGAVLPCALLSAVLDRIDPDIVPGLPQRLVTKALGVEGRTDGNEVEDAFKSMTNAKAVRPDDLPARAPARWSHSPGTPPSAPAITSVENGKSTGKTPPLRYSTRIRIGRSAAITVTSRSWPIYRQGAPQNGAAQRLLRDRPIIFCRRTAWASPQAVYHGYHVRDPPAAGTGVNSGGCFFFRCFVDLQEAYDTVDRASYGRH